jgi:hypothetical protein
MRHQELDAIDGRFKLPTFDLVCQHAKGEGASAAEGLLGGVAVDEDAGQIENFRDPAAVFFAL